MNKKVILPTIFIRTCKVQYRVFICGCTWLLISLQCGAGSSEADGHVMFVDASLPSGWFFTVLLLLSLASREHGSFPLASKSNNCKWQFARCVQTNESLIFLNLRVNCTNVLDLEEVHSCSGYSSTNLDRIRLQNSRVFFSQNRFSVA